MRRNCFLLVLFVLLATEPGWAQNRQPFIINGLPTDDFPAVGIVGELSVGGFCTGTLISPTHVLTAAHCAEAMLELGSANTGTFEINGQTYLTDRIEIHPDYNGRIFTNDVAVLVLQDAVVGVEPMLLSSRAPDIGEPVTLVGFGGQGTPQQGSDGSFGEKLTGTVMVDAVSDSEFSWLFDSTSESNPAPGDSGGPVFVLDDGVFLIAGIVSSGTAADAGLGDTSFSMLVPAFTDWIETTVFATSVPVPDQPEDPTPSDEPTPEPPVATPDDAEPPAEQPAAPSDPVDDTPTDDPELDPETDPALDSGDGEDIQDSDDETSSTSCPAANLGNKRPQRGNGNRRSGQRGHGQRGHGQRRVSGSNRPSSYSQSSRRRFVTRSTSGVNVRRK